MNAQQRQRERESERDKMHFCSFFFFLLFSSVSSTSDFSSFFFVLVCYKKQPSAPLFSSPTSSLPRRAPPNAPGPEAWSKPPADPRARSRRRPDRAYRSSSRAAWPARASCPLAGAGAAPSRAPPGASRRSRTAPRPPGLWRGPSASRGPPTSEGPRPRSRGQRRCRRSRRRPSLRLLLRSSWRERLRLLLVERRGRPCVCFYFEFKFWGWDRGRGC